MAEQEGAKAQEQPRPEPKPRQRTVDQETQSRLHRQAAEADKRATTAERRAEESERTLAALRESWGVDEDTEARAKRLGEREAEVSRQHRLAGEALRQATVRVMAGDYPRVPTDVYEELDDPDKMELAILRWEKANPMEGTLSAEGSVAQEAPGAEPAAADLGVPYVPSKSWDGMTDAEFDAETARMEKQSRAQLRRG